MKRLSYVERPVGHEPVLLHGDGCLSLFDQLASLDVEHLLVQLSQE